MSKTDIGRNINNEFASLFEAIGKVLQMMSPTEIIALLNNGKVQKDSKSPVCDIVLNEVSKSYNIPVEQMLFGNKRGRVQEARMIAYAILYNEVGYSYRTIGKIAFKGKNHGSVQQSLKQFEQLQPLKFASDKIIVLKYNEIKESVKNQITNLTNG